MTRFSPDLLITFTGQLEVDHAPVVAFQLLADMADLRPSDGLSWGSRSGQQFAAHNGGNMSGCRA